MGHVAAFSAPAPLRHPHLCYQHGQGTPAQPNRVACRATPNEDRVASRRRLLRASLTRAGDLGAAQMLRSTTTLRPQPGRIVARMDALCYHHGQRPAIYSVLLCLLRDNPHAEDGPGEPGPGLAITAHPLRRVLPAWTRGLLAGEAGQSPRASITVCYQRGQRDRRWSNPAFPATLTPILWIASRFGTAFVLPAWTMILRPPAACDRTAAGSVWTGCATSMDGFRRNRCEQHGRFVPAAWTVCATSVDIPPSTFLAHRTVEPGIVHSNESRFVAMSRQDRAQGFHAGSTFRGKDRGAAYRGCPAISSIRRSINRAPKGVRLPLHTAHNGSRSPPPCGGWHPSGGIIYAPQLACAAPPTR